MDLPAPFGPIRPRISPSSTVKLRSFHGLQAAEALAQARDLEERGHSSTSLQARPALVEPAHQPARREQHDPSSSAPAITSWKLREASARSAASRATARRERRRAPAPATVPWPPSIAITMASVESCRSKASGRLDEAALEEVQRRRRWPAGKPRRCRRRLVARRRHARAPPPRPRSGRWRAGPGRTSSA